jgi:NADH dehydrogenase
MSDMKILVIGGTGYIGTSLVKELNRRNHKITCMIRSDTKNKTQNFEYLTADLNDKKSLTNKLKKFDFIVDLAAVVRTIKKRKYKENVICTNNLVNAMIDQNIKKIVFFSTQKVHLRNKGPYAMSKWNAEKIVRNSHLKWLIVRPNYVYSVDKNNDFYRITKLASLFRIAPVIGNGNNKIQPVFREDLAKIVADEIENFNDNKIIEISGKKTVTITQAVSIITKSLGKKIIILHLPVFMLRPIKNLIPFDLDGYSEDMISRNRTKYGVSDFFTDLNKIIRL